MRTKLMLSMTAGLAVVLSQGVSYQASGAAGTAITGVVSSAEEGNMEGVVVSAQKAGSPIMISVTTDEHGRYNFPADRLEPGTYNRHPRGRLRHRSVGLGDGRRAIDGDERHQAREDQEPRQPAHQCRMDDEHSGHR